MIDNNELISTLRERAALYAYGSADSMACTAAASLLEAQAREIEQHDIEYSVRGLLLLDTERERDILRAQLAALQCEDELPEAEYAWRGSFDAGHWTDIRDKDCTLLYTADQLRQAQAMVRAKMVAAPVAPAQPVNAGLVEALAQAATSLETISRLAGKTHYVGDDGERVETYMGHHDQVRGYAISRAGVARTALSQAQSAPVQGVPEGWQPIETAPKWKNVLLFSIRYGSIFIDDWALYCTTNHPQITHWMPLPAVHRQEQKGGE